LTVSLGFCDANHGVINGGPSAANDHATAFYPGLVGSAGPEWKVHPALMLRTEWLYYDFAPEPHNHLGVSIPTQGGGVNQRRDVKHRITLPEKRDRILLDRRKWSSCIVIHVPGCDPVCQRPWPPHSTVTVGADHTGSNH
jgi:hypothetical protein